jgi:death-on-curing protein
MTVWLTFESFRDICFNLALESSWNEIQPIPDFNQRIPGRLEACLANPKQTFEGQLLYPTLVDQAAILFYSLNKGHCFPNGNKRIALTALYIFLFLNGRWLSIGHQELYEFSLRVAESDARAKDLTMEIVKDFLRAHMTEPVDLTFALGAWSTAALT